MNNHSRRRVGRILLRTLSLALILPGLTVFQRAAHAQNEQTISVIVGDIVDTRTKSASTPLAETAKKDIVNALTDQGSGSFKAISPGSILVQAPQLTPPLPVPSNPYGAYGYSIYDYIRLAHQVGASAVLSGDVAAIRGGKYGKVLLQLRLTDIASDEPINGAEELIPVQPLPGESPSSQEAIDDTVNNAALAGVTSMAQKQLVTATVLQINQGQVYLNKGTRDGIKDGDTVAILRQTPSGDLIKVGMVKVSTAYATESEADVLSNTGGIAPEDLARVLYTPEFVYTIAGGQSFRQVNSRINLSTIGKTLSAIGLGVLVAVAVRGGQTSTTNVVAEATTLDGLTPSVRVTWNNNIFGEAGVIQYKIYRSPDFPPGSTGAGSGSGTGGTGTGTGTGTSSTTIISGIPVGVTSGNFHVFYDRPSPNFPFLTNTFYTAASNGGLNTNTGATTTGGTGTGTGGGTGTGATGCTVNAVASDTGFTAGDQYQYYVSAIIERAQTQTSSTGGTTGGIGGGTGGGIGGGTGGGIGGGTGGGIGGGTGTGTGTGTGGGTGTGNNSAAVCIETDPSAAGFTTPIIPIQPTSPAANSVLDIRSFSPSWTSKKGADLFVVEVSTDRNFTTAADIYQVQVFSTAPNQDGVTQQLPTPINLTTAAPLLLNAAFSSYVSPPAGTTPATPTLFYRIGARHDEDTPGPVSYITQNANDSSRQFRFVYGQPVPFQPAPLPPPPPGKSVSKAALALNTAALTRGAGLLNPTMPRSAGIAAPGAGHPTTPQTILQGRGRTRH